MPIGDRIIPPDAIKPWIDRVIAGEIEALLPEQPVAGAMTRGTPKRIPITDTDLGIRVAAARGLLNHLLRTDQLDAIDGYSLNLNYPSVVGTMDVAGQETPYGFSSGTRRRSPRSRSCRLRRRSMHWAEAPPPVPGSAALR